jgi:hypothetical protein
MSFKKSLKIQTAIIAAAALASIKGGNKDLLTRYVELHNQESGVSSSKFAQKPMPILKLNSINMADSKFVASHVSHSSHRSHSSHYSHYSHRSGALFS